MPSTRKLYNVHKSVQKNSKTFKPRRDNVVSTGANTAKIWLSLYSVGCVRLSWYYGKMYIRHVFPTYDWSTDKLRFSFQSQIVFNRDILSCFRNTRPKDALQAKREKLVSVLHSLPQLVTSSLVPHQHQTLEALLTIDVHTRDVLDSMIANQVYQMEDFQWTR